MADMHLHPVSLDRMVRAVERVRERLRRATAALDHAAIPYAVIGGNAVAAWVSQVDESAVRNTPDVDILIRRDDLERVKAALAAVSFIYCHASGIDSFLDGPGFKPRDAVHVVFAGENVGKEYTEPAPDVTQSEKPGDFTVLALAALVRMKLTSFRLKDRVHLRDMIDVGLVDATWRGRLPSALADRLQQLLDTPEG
jgi:hypothetical protein